MKIRVTVLVVSILAVGVGAAVYANPNTISANIWQDFLRMLPWSSYNQEYSRSLSPEGDGSGSKDEETKCGGQPDEGGQCGGTCPSIFTGDNGEIEIKQTCVWHRTFQECDCVPTNTACEGTGQTACENEYCSNINQRCITNEGKCECLDMPECKLDDSGNQCGGGCPSGTRCGFNADSERPCSCIPEEDFCEKMDIFSCSLKGICTNKDEVCLVKIDKEEPYCSCD